MAGTNPPLNFSSAPALGNLYGPWSSGAFLREVFGLTARIAVSARNQILHFVASESAVLLMGPTVFGVRDKQLSGSLGLVGSE